PPPAATSPCPSTTLFRSSDGHGGTASATVAVTVTPANDAPVAVSHTASTSEDTAEAIVHTGSDMDGDSITFAIATGPANGVISGFNTNTGALIYTPNTNFNGADSFIFQVSDGTTTSAPATVTLTVRPINDAPVIQSIA